MGNWQTQVERIQNEYIIMQDKPHTRDAESKAQEEVEKAVKSLCRKNMLVSACISCVAGILSGNLLVVPMCLTQVIYGYLLDRYDIYSACISGILSTSAVQFGLNVSALSFGVLVDKTSLPNEKISGIGLCVLNGLLAFSSSINRLYELLMGNLQVELFLRMLSDVAHIAITISTGIGLGAIRSDLTEIKRMLSGWIKRKWKKS